MPQINPPQANPPMANTLALNDIHVPEQISSLPMAYGWWIVATAMLVLLMFLMVKARQKAKLKRHQQQALKQLKQASNMSDSDVIALLKWAAMQYFSRWQLAKLFGEQFQQFLVDKLPEKQQRQFNELAGNSFTEQYQVKDDKTADSNQKLHQAALLWLSHALPPKVKKITSKLANQTVEEKV